MERSGKVTAKEFLSVVEEHLIDLCVLPLADRLTESLADPAGAIKDRRSCVIVPHLLFGSEMTTGRIDARVNPKARVDRSNPSVGEKPQELRINRASRVASDDNAVHRVHEITIEVAYRLCSSCVDV